MNFAQTLSGINYPLCRKNIEFFFYFYSLHNNENLCTREGFLICNLNNINDFYLSLE